MNAKDIILAVMEFKRFTQGGLAEKLGYSTASAVSEKLRTKQGMRVDNFVKFVNAMDCEVIVRSKFGQAREWIVTLDASEFDARPKQTRKPRKTKENQFSTESD